MTPTAETYQSLEKAYHFFSLHLFEGRLPACLLTLQRHEKRSLGFFSPAKFVSDDGKSSDELAMNPRYFMQRDLTKNAKP